MEQEHNHANAAGFEEQPQAADYLPTAEPEPTADAQARTEPPEITDPTILEMIEKRIAEGVQQGVQAALKGVTPKANPTSQSAEQIAQFKKMSYRERNNLYRTNPAQYAALKAMVI